MFLDEVNLLINELIFNGKKPRIKKCISGSKGIKKPLTFCKRFKINVVPLGLEPRTT